MRASPRVNAEIYVNMVTIYTKNGPVYWMLIVHENISSTARAIRLKIQAFKKMSLLSYSSENVSDCATAVDETLEFIQHHTQDAKLPNDYLETLCGIFQKSTVEKFCMTVGLKLDKIEENPTAYDY